jgi:hypothetical protein
MAIALYNPRYIEVEAGRKLPNDADIKSFVWSHARWDLKVNELKKFPEDVGQALLKHFGFLIKVDKKNLEEIKKMMADKKFKCPHCDFETDYKMALSGHMKTHTSEDNVELEGVEEAKPKGAYQPPKPSRRLSPEEASGIPKGDYAKDKDGVEWYGEGVKKDKI